MNLLTATPFMVTIREEVSFRFSQIKPPSCHAVAGVAFIKFAHPLHGIFVGGIDKAHGVVGEPFHIAYILVGKVAVALEDVIVGGGIAGEERLGDADGVYILVFEVGKHLRGVGEVGGVPFEVAHPGRAGTLPVQVEYDAIERQFRLVLDTVDHIFSLIGGVIAVARGDISQSPEGWQRLVAGEEVIILHCFFHRAAAHEVVGNGVGRLCAVG